MRNLLKCQKKKKKKIDSTTENLSDYLYHQEYYKSIATDLSRQRNTSIPQKINFIGKLNEDDGATMFSC